MGGLSVSHWAIVLLLVFVLFGRGRISDVMGDFGNGISSFRKGLRDDDEADASAMPSQFKLTPGQSRICNRENKAEMTGQVSVPQ